MITAATWGRRHLLDTAEKKAFVCRTLLQRAAILGWCLEAWAVLSNHYHCVARSADNGISLVALVRAVHSITGKQINAIDGTPGRRVWYNYWDTCITEEDSYLARLHYVHMNPLRHGLLRDPEDYPFCSYRSFLAQSEPRFREKVLASSIDRLVVMDDF
jgi:putative transposase